MKKIITYIVLLLMIVVDVSAQSHQSDSIDNKELTISLITCYPGPEVYELYGHSAVRVKTSDFDIIYNYGVFNYSDPNFVYRFVKGKTDYMAAMQYFEHFLYQYKERGSKVVEQTLNLSEDEAKQLWNILQTDVLPQNRVYRYNYVKNNCATKILDCFDKIEGLKITYPDSIRFGTFRKEMRHYGQNYDWYQFGIDMALGSGIDYSLQSREEMFVPVIMMQQMKDAKRNDGANFVCKTETIYEGSDSAILPATPFVLSPLFVSVVALLLIIAFSLWSVKQRRMIKWVYAVWFGLCGLAGCLIAFLVFISEHEATSPNILVWWLNPVMFVVSMFVWSEKGRKVVSVFMIVEMICLIGILIGTIFGEQSLNGAVYPLITATMLLSTTYVVLTIKHRNIGTATIRKK